MEKRVFYISTKDLSDSEARSFLAKLQENLKMPFKKILNVKQWKQMKNTINSPP